MARGVFLKLGYNLENNFDDKSMATNVKNILIWLLVALIVGSLGFFSAGLIFKDRPGTPPVTEIIKDSGFSASGKLLSFTDNSITVESEKGREVFTVGESTAIIISSGSPADESYLIPGVSVVVSGRDGLASEIKATDLPEIIISAPAAFSPIGLNFDLTGFYKTSAPEVVIRLTNGRTNATYFEKKISPGNKARYYESFSENINLKTAFDVLDKDNLTLSVVSPAGKEVRSLVFSGGLTARIKVPFLNKSSCSSVTESERLISASKSSVRSAMEEMIAGPSESERALGIHSAFPSGTEIRVLRFDNTAISVDFSRELSPASINTCLSSGLKAQLTAALKQFPAVSSYEFKIDGQNWYASK